MSLVKDAVKQLSKQFLNDMAEVSADRSVFLGFIMVKTSHFSFLDTKKLEIHDPDLMPRQLWVPTAALRNGDFTGLGVTIWDPASRISTGIGTRIYGKYYPDCQESVRLRKQFWIIIRPNCPAQTKLIGNIFDATLTEKTDPYRNWTFRIDQNITCKNRMFVAEVGMTEISVYNDYMGTAASGNIFIFISRQGVIDDVHIFDASTVLNIRYGFNRFIRLGKQREEAQGFDLTLLGFPAAYNSLTSAELRRFPSFDFTGGMLGTGFGNEFRPTTTHSPSATLNKTFGKHSLKIGAELRIYREDSTFTSNDQTGSLFLTILTQDLQLQLPMMLTASSIRIIFAGLANYSTIARRADYSEYSKTYGFFVQDDWKPTKKLTVNLGFRYEIETPLRERKNKSIAILIQIMFNKQLKMLHVRN